MTFWSSNRIYHQARTECHHAANSPSSAFAFVRSSVLKPIRLCANSSACRRGRPWNACRSYHPVFCRYCSGDADEIHSAISP